MIIAFDVDGTLIDFMDSPREEIVTLLRILVEAGQDVLVWSGGGKGYAETVGRRLGLPDEVLYADKWDARFKTKVDLAIDDDDALLARQMLKIGRRRVASSSTEPR